MSAPHDPIIDQCDYFQQAELFEITGNVYGLASAPWSWICEVIERLNTLGFVCHSLDSMCFMLYNKKYELICIAMFHVDDVLITWDETWDINTFKDLFEWGEWIEAPNNLTYVARQIRFEPLAEGNSDGMSVVVYQEKCIRAIGNAKVFA